MDERDPLLLPSEVAAELKISARALAYWIKAGRLRVVKIGRSTRIHRSEVNRLLAGAQSESKSE